MSDLPRIPWETGMVVRLKSGGPNMTITGIGGGFVGCDWFVGGERKTAEFPEDAVEAA